MAGEEDVIEQPATVAEVESAEESAAFAASFDNEVRADEAPATEETVVEAEAETETGDATGELEAETVQTEDATPEEKVGVTAEELTAMLAKLPGLEETNNMSTAEIRKLHGKIGEINRSLIELQKSNQGNSAPVKLAGVTLKRLHEEYPELAELLAQDLNESGTAGEEAAQPSVNFDEKVAQVKEDLTKEMQTNLLRIQHRDFLTVIQSPDFSVWKQTLPAEDQAELDNSWDAMYLGEKITAFKDWHAQKQTGANQRKERLSRAITPRGNAAPLKPLPMTEEDGFNAALKS
jgi:hypothetical protein